MSPQPQEVGRGCLRLLEQIRAKLKQADHVASNALRMDLPFKGELDEPCGGEAYSSNQAPIGLRCTELVCISGPECVHGLMYLRKRMSGAPVKPLWPPPFLESHREKPGRKKAGQD